LQRGHYPAAVASLEEAVRLDPLTSKNHANLAAAYLASGRKKEAWKHSRIAVGLNPNDGAGRGNFGLFWNDYQKQGLLSSGTSQERVRKMMGESDFIKTSAPGVLWIYGRKGIHFQNGRLTEVNDL
jgi:tetratricopeptide (TPR) repeat protein